MNVMFLTIENYIDFNERSIYMDLVNEFRRQGHYVTVISACEKRDIKMDTPQICSNDCNGEIRKIYVANVTKMSNFVLKGINLLRLSPAYKKAATQAMKQREYDLVIYNSPPITISDAVKAVKTKQNAYCYLLLKDIWPYDCLFGGALSLKGPKKLAFDYLALLARRLYNVSDTIGCMSPANIRFLIENEPYLAKSNKLDICPNSILPQDFTLTIEEKNRLRNKYHVPTDKTIFIYGGSLGVPQGMDFALEAIREAKQIKDAFFLFIGGGTEKEKIKEYAKNNNLKNFVILDTLPKDEYEKMIFASDVGLVFLHHECLAPNYPSRILGYMQASLPILCATDTYTDVGKIAEENDYGISCESNNKVAFVRCVKELCSLEERKKMGSNAYRYLIENYTVEKGYRIITEKMKKR